MIEVVWDQGFKRSYRKRISRAPHLNKQFWEKMELFLDDPFSLMLMCGTLSRPICLKR